MSEQPKTDPLEAAMADALAAVERIENVRPRKPNGQEKPLAPSLEAQEGDAPAEANAAPAQTDSTAVSVDAIDTEVEVIGDADAEPADEQEAATAEEPEAEPEPEPEAKTKAETEAKTRAESEPAGAADTEAVAAARDQLVRLAADFENYRKRSLRELEDVRRFGNQKLLAEILPVLDNLERALSHVEGTDDPIAAGVRMVAKQFLDVLGRFGVKRFDSKGQPFDPERHEAMTQVPTDDHPPGTVVEELSKGYFLNDRLLRPAQVVVARPTPKPAAGDE